MIRLLFGNFFFGGGTWAIWSLSSGLTARWQPQQYFQSPECRRRWGTSWTPCRWGSRWHLRRWPRRSSGRTSSCPASWPGQYSSWIWNRVLWQTCSNLSKSAKSCAVLKVSIPEAGRAGLDKQNFALLADARNDLEKLTSPVSGMSRFEMERFFVSAPPPN